MTANDWKSYLAYLNKLAVEYNNAYYRSIGKKPIDADYSALTERIENWLKELYVGDRVKITTYKNIFSKGYTKNWSK